MNRSYKRKKNNKKDFKNQIIKKQIDEIESLKQIVSELETDCEGRDKLIKSINKLRGDLLDIVDDLREKGNEYDKLIKELKEMKKVMNQTVFKGRWKLIRLLLK